MCKNIVEPDMPQMTIWHMHIACWVTKATNTHSGYVTHIAFPLQQWLHKCARMLCYIFTASVIPHYLMNSTIFERKQVIEHEVCDLIFYTFSCLKPFFILRSIKREFMIKVDRSLHKVLVILVRV